MDDIEDVDADFDDAQDEGAAGMADPAALGVPADSYYAILNVPRDVSDADLKLAYRRLCMIFHPDKHTDPAAKEAATRSFRAINEAYKVLSDPGKRTIYDLYGLDGLRAGYEVGPRLKSPAEIRAEYERLKELNELAAQQRNATSKGECVARIDATNLINPYFDADEPIGLAQILELLPEVKQLSVTQALDICCRAGGPPRQFHQSPTRTIGVNGSIVSRNGVAVASLAGTWKQRLPRGFFYDATVAMGTNNLLRLKVGKDFSDNSTLSLTGNLVLLEEGIGASGTALLVRPLSRRVGGWMTYDFGGQSILGVGLTYAGDRNVVRSSVQLSDESVAVELNETYKLSDKTKLRAKVDLAPHGVAAAVGVEQGLSEISRVLVQLELSSRTGVLVRFRYTRVGQVFALPVLLDTEPSLRALAIGVAVPSFLGYLLKKFVLDPRAHRQRQRELEEQREQMAEITAQRQREALDAVALMLPTVREKVEAEERADGLVILEAKYGNLRAANGSTPADPLQPLVIDVTVPLQALVNNSQLRLHAHSKASLLGFYDPCIGEPKQLRIVYLFRRRRHEVVLDDLDEVALPMRCACLR